MDEWRSVTNGRVCLLTVFFFSAYNMLRELLLLRMWLDELGSFIISLRNNEGTSPLRK